MDHARANAAAVRRQSSENRQRKADEEAAAAAAEAAARAATAVPGVRSSGYASPAYHPGCERIRPNTAAGQSSYQRLIRSGPACPAPAAVPASTTTPGASGHGPQ